MVQLVKKQFVLENLFLRPDFRFVLIVLVDHLQEMVLLSGKHTEHIGWPAGSFELVIHVLLRRRKA